MLRKLIPFYNDPEYFRNIYNLATPIIAQQFMFSALKLVGVILVGQKGEISVAAMGLANQGALPSTLVHFGIVSGAAGLRTTP